MSDDVIPLDEIGKIETVKVYNQAYVDKLEKENAKLKKENKVLAQNLEDTEILNKTYEKRFDDLEKENAELKDDNKVMADNYSKMEQKFYDNLTKAKEIIKKFLLWENDWHDKTESKYELLKQAEQFLKDCEVEK